MDTNNHVQDYDVQDEYVLWISLLLERGRDELAKMIAREQLLRTAQYVESLNATIRDANAIADAEADVHWLKAS